MTIKDFKNSFGMWVKKCAGKDTYSYAKWYAMVARCKVGGCVQQRHPSYVGCTMSENFKDFQFFASWITQQVGYGIDGYQLDKDCLIEKNKLYSEDTCVLIPNGLNSFLTSKVQEDNKYSQGVTLHKPTGLFRAKLGTNNEKVCLGYFKTLEEASSVYRSAKEEDAYRWYNLLLRGDVLVDERVTERMRVWKLR